MRVLARIAERFGREQPLRGVRIAACLHVTAETANLVRTLAAGGADVVLVASNPLSTQDDVAAALVERHGIRVLARRGEDRETYYGHISTAVDHAPHITMDDGADLIGVLHGTRRDGIAHVIGGTEDTATGIIRLRALHASDGLAFPVFAVNGADTTRMFDTRYGAGQSVVDGLLRATNVLIAGRRALVAGYGGTGRGVAERLRGLGALVSVAEVDALRALEAVMDGFDVRPLADAARECDVFVTATGDVGVIREEHFAVMRDGALIANAGHFDVEIDLAALRSMSTAVRTARPHVQEYRLADGRTVCVLAEGRVLNLGVAEGHPAAVMDVAGACQALLVEHLLRYEGRLEPGVHAVPSDVDREIASVKLQTLGVTIDELSDTQRAYLDSWAQGT